MAPPVPIPNTEVKRCSPDGSTAIGRARVGRRQNTAAQHVARRAGRFVLAMLRTREESRAVGQKIDGQASERGGSSQNLTKARLIECTDKHCRGAPR